MSVQRIVVGLGNPDPEHAGTRHNIGWMIADALADTLGASWEDAKKLHAAVARDDGTLVVKPTTYMNKSGQAVKAALDFYKVPKEDLLVISDDINLPFGELRLRDKGGAGGQGGLKDIIAQLGSEDFARLRIGVDGPPGPDATPHVLGRFTQVEQDALPAVMEQAVMDIQEWLRG
jgi:PTH1 family peptidyl-tRNA hydrolase